MNLESIYRLYLECSGVSTDTRKTVPESMFFALRGASFNGNAYATNALDNGCKYAVVDEPAYAVSGDERYILVDDCLETLQLLARYHRKQLGTKIIGITGTNGKTTTKELIAAVLSQKFSVLYTEGNLNNHIGVPLTLLRLKPSHEIAVVEMGANHPGEIKFLSNIAEPDYGIITNVGKAHLEGFGSFEGVIRTKSELYDFLRRSELKTVFVDYDNPYLTKMAAGLNTVYYGKEENLFVNGRVTGNSPFLSMEWRLGDGNYRSLDTRLIGSYNFTNILAAITIGCYFDVDKLSINKALQEYTPRNNRSQLTKTEKNTLIVDAYNANPTSMMAALENFRQMDGNLKIVILGDMRELGNDSRAEHLKIIDYLETAGFEKVILIGEEFSSLKSKFDSFGNVDDFINDIERFDLLNKVILIKGSNGVNLNRVIPFL